MSQIARVPGSIPTGGTFFTEIYLLFNTKQYKKYNIAKCCVLRENPNVIIHTWQQTVQTVVCNFAVN